MDSTEIKLALEGLTNDATVPAWAKILINCFQTLVVNRQETDSLAQRTNQLEETMATKGELDQLRTENRLMKIQMAALQDELDAAEQYSRRNCLVFHGIPEEKGEKTGDKIMEIVHNTLKVDSVTKGDIDRSHRMGKFSKPLTGRQTRSSPNQGPRPIIVKFKGYDSRNDVFKVKRYLKGSNILITENLTKKRYELLKDCIKLLGKGNVWTYDGRITTKLDDKTYFVINSKSDLLSLSN